jgi:hypothetical protein
MGEYDNKIREISENVGYKYGNVVEEFEKKNLLNSKEQISSKLKRVFEGNYLVNHILRDEDNKSGRLGDFGYDGDPVSDLVIGTMFKTLKVVEGDGNKVTMRDLKSEDVSRGEIKKFFFDDKDGQIFVDYYTYRHFNLRMESGFTLEKKREILEAVGNLEVYKKLNRLADEIEEIEDKEGESWIRTKTGFSDEETKIFSWELDMCNEEEGVMRKRYSEFSPIELRREEDGQWRMSLDREVMKGKKDNHFIYGQTAEQLFDLWNSCGLKIRQQLLGAMTGGVLGIGKDSKRYGTEYASLTRRLVSYVGLNEDEAVKFLFENPDKNSLDKFKERSGWVNDEGARLATGIMIDLAGGNKEEVKNKKDLWRNSGLGREGDGACEDSEYYLVDQGLREGKSKIDEDFLYYYPKSEYDFYMAMTRRGIEVEGVHLPAGFLCRVSPEGEVLPVRAGMFGFELSEARKIFGSQFDKFEKEVGKDRVGGVFSGVRQLFE